MSIELFKKTNYRGKSLRRINSDSSDLRDTILGNNPSSIKITDDNKAILLCKKKNWNGKVFYLRGKKNISDLGDENDGGKKGFGNSITSIRVTPFTVKLNITIVTGDDVHQWDQTRLIYCPALGGLKPPASAGSF